MICTLRVNTCEVSDVLSGLSCNARMFAQPKKLIDSLPNYKKPDFPSLADQIAKPCQDMNIKVAGFTVSEKSINTCINYKHRYIRPLDKRP